MHYTRIDRTRFCDLTGYSEDQYSAWFAPTETSRARSPSIEQMGHITQCLDWSPTYIMHGIGDQTLSGINAIHEQLQQTLTLLGTLEVNAQSDRDVMIALLNQVLAKVTADEPV